MEEKQTPMNFDAIPIPEELEHTVAQAVRRGLRVRRLRRLSCGCAAVLAAALLTANVPVLYAGAQGLPILGPMVRILRTGSGGEAGGVVQASVLRTSEGVELHFVNDSGQLSDAPIFSAVRHTAPQRVVLRLHGVSQPDTAALLDALQQTPAVADAYPIAVSDPHQLGVTFLLNNGYDCTIGEYGSPTALSIQLRAGETAANEPVWCLQSEALEFGPQLAAATDALLWEGGSQLKTADGHYVVTVGSYRTQAKADEAAAGLSAKSGIPLQPVLSSRFQSPEHLFREEVHP